MSREKLDLDECLTRWTSFLTFPPTAPTAPKTEFQAFSSSLTAALTQAMGHSRHALSRRLARPIMPTPDVIPTGLLQDLQKIGIDGAFKDMRTLVDMVKAKVLEGGIVDDKSFLMERTIQIASGLPPTSKNEKLLTGALLDKLWNQLQHPPISYIGLKDQYRSADGSGNNIMYPHLGKAGMPYARSVRPMKKMPGARPDPGLIFDVLLRRDPASEKNKPHPNKISSMLFYLASIIIHDLFRTSHEDYSISKTSSYLDLSPLYGSNAEEQFLMRTHKDGKIKQDAFSERRLLGFPAGVCVLLLSFGRFHNATVEMLLKIDQDQRFTKLREEKDRDEKLFQTGRLITCGLYINIILIDYIRVILNLTRTESTWCLDPRSEIEKVFGATGSPQGIGNQVSAEFNLVYRWHSVISPKDAKWTEELYAEIFPGRNPKEVSLREFMLGVKDWEAKIPADPQLREFGGLKRNETTKLFKEEDLIRILCESVEDCANAYGPNGVPEIMKAVEILGIEQSRAWELASLNEFRAFFGLKEYESFEEITSNQDTAEALRQLYGHPDYVEIYPGLVVEDAKIPMTPGAGLLPGYTISTAILADAVALVRGDRFYTVDYTTGNLTNWGYNEVASDPAITYGGVVYKLFHRAFPGWFAPNSVYAMFPFTTPEEMKVILRGFGKENKYSFERPTSRYEHVASARIKHLIDEKDPDVNKILLVIINSPSFLETIEKSLINMTKETIQKNSSRLNVGNFVDIIRDVGNLVAVRTVAELFSLPLTGVIGTADCYSAYELHGALCTIANYVYRVSPVPDAKAFELQEAATSFWDTLLGVTFDRDLKLNKNNSRLDPTGLGPLSKVVLPFMEATPKAAVLTAAKLCLDISIGFAEILRDLLPDAENLRKIEKASDSNPVEALTAAKRSLDKSNLAIRTGAADPAQHKILASMLQGLGTFKNVRAAPGPQGKIHSVIVESVGKDGDIDAAEAYISEDWDTLASFPYSLKIMYD